MKRHLATREDIKELNEYRAKLKTAPSEKRPDNLGLTKAELLDALKSLFKS